MASKPLITTDFQPVSPVPLGGITEDFVPVSSAPIDAGPEGTRGVTGSWDKSIVDELPGMGGGILGGILSATKRTPAGMAAAGIGGAGGEAWQQVYQQLTGNPDAPSTPGEAAKRILKEGGTQAIGELGGRALIGGISKIIAPFKKTIKPELLKSNEALKAEMGTPVGLTPAQMTDSHKLDTIESIAENSWTGGDTIKAHRLLENQGYQNMERSILDDLNKYSTTRATPEEVGMMFKDSKAASEAVYKRLASIKFNKVDSLVKGVSVNLYKLKSEAILMQQSLLARKGVGSSAEKDALINKIIEMDDFVSFSDAQAIRTGLREELESMAATADKGRGVAKRFIQMIDGSMENAAKKASPDVYSAWREANQFYKGYRELFKSNFMRNLDKIAINAPQKIVQSVFRNGAAPQIRNVKKVVKPATWDKLKASYTEDLFLNVQRPGGEVGGEALKKKLLQMRPEALKEIYTPAELSSIRAFVDIGAAQQAKIGGSGGMLIQLMQAGAIAGIGAGIFTGSPDLTGGSVVSSGLILISPKILAKMLLNPTWSKLLTVGLKMPRGSRGAISIGSKLTAQYAKMKAEEE